MKMKANVLFQLEGMLRVILEPLIGQAPLVGGVTMFFIRRPVSINVVVEKRSFIILRTDCQCTNYRNISLFSSDIANKLDRSYQSSGLFCF